MLFMKGFKVLGIMIELFFCWLFLRMVIIILGIVYVVVFKVCVNCGGGRVFLIFLVFVGGCRGIEGVVVVIIIVG